MAEWVSVFETAEVDMKAEGLNVELKSIGWHLFEKVQFDSRATGTCVKANAHNRRNSQLQPFWTLSGDPICPAKEKK